MAARTAPPQSKVHARQGPEMAFMSSCERANSTTSRPVSEERNRSEGPRWPLSAKAATVADMLCWLFLTHSGPRILILKYWQKRPSGPFAAGNFDYHHAAIQTTQPGSMPFAFSTDAAAGAVSNFINALAASGSLELEAIPAAKMVYNCNSVGNGPRSSTPRTDTSSLA
jgi:hypothetical protein